MALSRDRAKCRLRSKVDQLATEIALVLGHTLVQTTRKTGVYKYMK